jgi:hypothetical protein
VWAFFLAIPEAARQERAEAAKLLEGATRQLNTEKSAIDDAQNRAAGLLDAARQERAETARLLDLARQQQGRGFRR